MIKLPLSSLFIMLACFSSKASVTLTAIPDSKGSSVSLQWNMVNHSSVTAYLLLRSIDGVVWQIAAANPVFRNYTSVTILAYSDKVTQNHKLFYRVRVYDSEDNTVGISNTAIAEIPKAMYNAPARSRPSPKTQKSNPVNVKAWQIYPNPVYEILNLTYKGKEKIMGVINVLISDATGKIIIRFRQASNNKQLLVPVRNLRAGLYFIKINVLNEMQLNERFIKQ
ncbi:MAG: T9SS type A sorting domain-containing protein [Ginsengibacter sp.]